MRDTVVGILGGLAFGGMVALIVHNVHFSYPYVVFAGLAASAVACLFTMNLLRRG